MGTKKRPSRRSDTGQLRVLCICDTCGHKCYREPGLCGHITTRVCLGQAEPPFTFVYRVVRSTITTGDH